MSAPFAPLFSPGYAGDLSPQEAWDLLEADPDAVLVDVRSQPEWLLVGVPDLASLGRQAAFVEWSSFGAGPIPDFVGRAQAAASLVEGRKVVLLCRSGQRSIAAAEALTAAGLGPAYNVLTGFEGGADEFGHRGAVGWKAAGLPWRQQ